MDLGGGCLDCTQSIKKVKKGNECGGEERKLVIAGHDYEVRSGAGGQGERVS